MEQTRTIKAICIRRGEDHFIEVLCGNDEDPLSNSTKCSGPVFCGGSAVFDYKKNEDAVLTDKELRIILAAMSGNGHVVSSDTIKEKIWHSAYITDENVKTHICNARRKIGDDDEYILETVHRAGLRWHGEDNTIKRYEIDNKTNMIIREVLSDEDRELDEKVARVRERIRAMTCSVSKMGIFAYYNEKVGESLKALFNSISFVNNLGKSEKLLLEVLVDERHRLEPGCPYYNMKCRCLTALWYFTQYYFCGLRIDSLSRVLSLPNTYRAGETAVVSGSELVNLKAKSQELNLGYLSHNCAINNYMKDLSSTDDMEPFQPSKKI